MIRINSNLYSLNAQRNLGEHTSSLREAFERLSSGLRINKAADDAAGLAIASLLDVDRRVTVQAVRNINDGISYLNVAESALGELTNISVRIAELAEQGANGTLGSDQRAALQSEVTSLQSEWNRIVESTSFNGNQLLTGSTTQSSLQGGYGIDSRLIVQVGDAAIVDHPEYAAGLTTLASSTSAGVEGDNVSYIADISAEGRYVLFQSEAGNLVSNDTNGVEDVFLKDSITGSISRVSTSSSGTESDFATSGARISADGRYVALTSAATNLVEDDSNGVFDIFVKNIATGSMTRVSTDSNGNEANSASGQPVISADGRYVVFSSSADNLVEGDTNGLNDIFLKDTLTGITTRISTSSSGTEASGGNSEAAAISADGRYVAFNSTATNLVSGDSNGGMDGFIKDTVTGVTTRVTTNSAGGQVIGSSTVTAVSADGRYVAFYSNADTLVSGDSNGSSDAFVKDTVTGITTSVSTNSSGIQGNGDSFVRSISADGRYVGIFSDADNLVSNDTNFQSDAFIKDTLTGLTRAVSSDSSGEIGAGFSTEPVMSADGRFVAFHSDASSLVEGLGAGQQHVMLRDMSMAGVQQLSGMVVSNQASARITLDLVKLYQEELSEYRAGIGASLSRAATFVSTLQINSENFASAASQIVDADVATEAAYLTRTSILQQAAAAVLGQANQQPQLALSLLSGI